MGLVGHMREDQFDTRLNCKYSSESFGGVDSVEFDRKRISRFRSFRLNTLFDCTARVAQWRKSIGSRKRSDG